MKSMMIGCFLGSFLEGCQPPTPTVGNRLLSDGWKIQSSAQLQQTGETLSTPQAEVQHWYEATVPSTVLGTLTRNGVYADALEGMSYEQIDRSLFDTTWWYRTTFDLPELNAGQHIALAFDGISYAANIWLNGQQVATRDSIAGPFRQFRLDVTKWVGPKNVLAVEVFRGQPGEPNIGYADWNPRPADESMGIFREVRVLTSREVAMQHATVRSKVNTETLDEAWLTVETELVNLSDQAVEGTLQGTLEGETFTLPVTLKANETRTVQVNAEQVPLLHRKHPRLWWCHNLGTPDMYQMDLEFRINGQCSDQEQVNFGIREIGEYFTEEGHRGFLLNGKKVLVRGAGWTDDIFLRNTPETNEIQVQYVRDMNLNAIRFENVWGTSQNVYDLCDRYGLLVLVGWSCHWEWEAYLGSPCDEFGGIRSEADMNLIARSLHDQVCWLRSHPSIIAWYVGSDMIPRPELEKRYLSFLPQIDDRPYVAAAKAITSELTGPTGMKMAGPYDYVAPNYWYAQQAPGGAIGFNTETGIGAQLPVKESILKMIPADKLWPVGVEWDYHCTKAGEAMHSLDVLKEVITARYGAPTDLDDFLRKADWTNYEGTRAMFEAFRTHIPQSTGIIQWMLNSAWPSLYWQLYDYYLAPTAAYYSVKRSNLPQQLIYDYGKQAVVAVNEGAQPCSVTAEMQLYGWDGQLQSSQTRELTIDPYTTQSAFEVPEVKDNAFLFLRLSRTDGEALADNFYCLSAQPDENDWAKTTWIRTPVKQSADFTRLAALPEADCSVQATVRAQAENTLVEVTLTNAPSALAFFTRLSLTDAQGELLTPVFWEDNYVSLRPGEKRTLTCTVPSSVRPTGALTLTVAGWNVPEKKIVLSLGKQK